MDKIHAAARRFMAAATLQGRWREEFSKVPDDYNALQLRAACIEVRQAMDALIATKIPDEPIKVTSWTYTGLSAARTEPAPPDEHAKHEALRSEFEACVRALRRAKEELVTWRVAVDEREWGEVAIRLTSEAIGGADAALSGTLASEVKDA